MKTIRTKNKGQFLIAEWNHYKPHFKSFKEYYEIYIEDIKQCKGCGTYFWHYCIRRCNCKPKKK